MVPTTVPTWAVVGVDEASPCIFILAVIGWSEEDAVTGYKRGIPFVLVNESLEDATKSAVYAGEAVALRRIMRNDIYLLDIVVGNRPPAVGNYPDRFKVVLQRTRKMIHG